MDVRQGLAHQTAERRGSALVMALVVLTTLMVLSVAFLQVGLASSERQVVTESDRSAIYLAEAGVAEAITAVLAGSTGGVGDQNTPARLGEGLFWVDATDLGGNQTQLVVTAMAGSGRAALEVVVENSAPRLINGVIKIEGGIDLHTGVLIDSFDSSVGTYASQAVNTQGHHTYALSNAPVITNDAIELHTNGGVFGDATPGPGSAVSLHTGAFVTGSTNPASEPFVLEPIVVPTAVSSGDLTVAKNSPLTIGPGTIRYGALEINKDAKLTIEGPAEIVLDDFFTNRGSSLIIDATNGPVTVYCEDQFEYARGFKTIAATGSPMDLVYKLTVTEVEFPSQAEIVGGFYAPDAAFHFSSHNEVWGSIVGGELYMHSKVDFHFDEYLFNRQVDTADPEFSIVAWNQASLNNVPFAAKRTDPFELLGVEWENLPLPANAWK